MFHLFNLQGPNSGEIMVKLYLVKVLMILNIIGLENIDLDGIPLIVSRTGWSSELGYELYLRDGSKRR